MTWNYVDLCLIVLFIFAIYRGFKKGLVLSIASLLGLLLGVYGGMYFSDYFTVILKERWEIELPLLAFALTFIFILLAIYFLGKLIEKLLKIIALGLINKILGAVFSFAKYVLIIAVLLYIVEQTLINYPVLEFTYIQKAQLYPYILQLEEWVFPYIRQITNS